MIIIKPLDMSEISIVESNLEREDIPEWQSGGPVFLEAWGDGSAPPEASRAVAYSPTGNYIAITGDYAPYIRIIDGTGFFHVDGPELIQATVRVTDVSFSPDGQYLALSCYGSVSLNRRALYVWSTSDWSLVFSSVADRYSDVGWAGESLLVGSVDNAELYIYSRDGWSLESTIGDFAGRLSNSPDGQYFAFRRSDIDARVRLFRSSDFSVVSSYDIGSTVTSTSLNNENLFVASEDNVGIGEISTSGVFQQNLASQTLRISFISSSPSGGFTVSGRTTTNYFDRHYSDSLELLQTNSSAGRGGAYSPDSSYYVLIPRARTNEEAYMLLDVPEYTRVAGDPVVFQLGDQAIRFNRIYESLTDGNTTAPDIGVNAEPPQWLDLGYTNEYRFIDGNSSPPSTAVNEIDVTISAPGVNGGIGFFNVDADSIQIIVTDPVDGVVYENDFSMISQAEITDWWQYFFAPYTLKSDSALIDLPAYPDANVRIIIKKEGGIAKLGNLAFGKVQILGDTLYGTSVGIIDYSRKETDEFGNFSILKRNFSKRVDYDATIPTNQVSGVQQTLASIRATPVVWIGDVNKEETIVYGYFRDFDIPIAGPCSSDLTISVEGL